MRRSQLLVEQLDAAREWTLRLVADIQGPDWAFQPGPGLAHPLWLCGHLACAQNLLVHVRCLGRGVLKEDFTIHFRTGGTVPAVDEHDYPSAGHVLATMADLHRRTVEAVQAMGDDLLAEPAFGPEGKPHPHYHDKYGAVVHCSRHEAFHAGQLALIRRLLGRSFLR